MRMRYHGASGPAELKKAKSTFIANLLKFLPKRYTNRYTLMIKVLFFRWKYRTNFKAEAPLYCRISIQGQRKQFSTGFWLKENQWSSKRQRVFKHANSETINNFLLRTKDGLTKIYWNLKMNDGDANANEIHAEYFGSNKIKTLLSTYDEMISIYESLEGKDYCKSTVQKIINSKRHIIRALNEKGLKDIKLTQLKTSFIEQVYHLSRKKGYAVNTTNKNLKILKQVIKHAVNNAYLNRDPFTGYRLKNEKPQINVSVL